MRDIEGCGYKGDGGGGLYDKCKLKILEPLIHDADPEPRTRTPTHKARDEGRTTSIKSKRMKERTSKQSKVKCKNCNHLDVQHRDALSSQRLPKSS